MHEVGIEVVKCSVQGRNSGDGALVGVHRADRNSQVLYFGADRAFPLQGNHKGSMVAPVIRRSGFVTMSKQPVQNGLGSSRLETCDYMRDSHRFRNWEVIVFNATTPVEVGRLLKPRTRCRIAITASNRAFVGAYV
jgi:hypothetical protein